QLELVVERVALDERLQCDDARARAVANRVAMTMWQDHEIARRQVLRRCSSRDVEHASPALDEVKCRVIARFDLESPRRRQARSTEDRAGEPRRADDLAQRVGERHGVESLHGSTRYPRASAGSNRDEGCAHFANIAANGRASNTVRIDAT